MHTSDGLIDLHQRSHESLRKMLDHCAGFSGEELGREWEGFGYPSLRLQLHHVVGAEQYWVGVLSGLMLVDEDEADYASIDALCAFRERVAGVTETYLRSTTGADLNTRREMTTWGDKRVLLLPAHVVLRTQTHVFQHLGQVTAMCRLLGRPVPPGFDFSLT